jgi:hypothetical protein
MFKSARARFILRLSIIGVLAFCSSLKAAGTDSVTLSVVLGAISATVYAIVGALSPAEPGIGAKAPVKVRARIGEGHGTTRVVTGKLE